MSSVCPSTLEAEIRGSLFEAILGKKLVITYLKKKLKAKWLGAWLKR
jgi:hypothetical protein